MGPPCIPDSLVLNFLKISLAHIRWNSRHGTTKATDADHFQKLRGQREKARVHYDALLNILRENATYGNRE